MTGQPPKYRLIVKGPEDTKWTEVGAVWERAAGKFGVRITLPDTEPFDCLMVLATQKPATEPTKPAGKKPPGKVKTATP